MNIGLDAVSHRPSDVSRPALSVETDEPLTYAELTAGRDALADRLAATGLGPGERVGLFMENDICYWPLYLAITSLGAVCVRLNFRWTASELAHAVLDSDCRTLLVHETLAPVARAAVKDIADVVRVVVFGPHSPASLDAALAAAADRPPAARADRARDGDQAMIMYTSGTTGRPKGVIWTHSSTLSFGVMQILQWNFVPETVSLTVGPAYHVGSFEDLALPTLMAGGHTIMMRSKGFSVRRAAEVMAAKRVTDVLLFPAMVRELLDQRLAERYDLSSLRRILTGGSSLRPWVVTELAAQLPEARIHSIYGLTEGGGMSTTMDPGGLARRPDCVGRPLPLARVRIVRADDAEAAPGEVGEIQVSGPNVAHGYLSGEDTAAAWTDGWLKTGDLGMIDAESGLYVVGRLKDMIRTGDENVYAAEVEQVISTHPSVADVAVIGVPDDKWGEIVCAVVVSHDEAEVDADEIRRHCQAQLAGYKKPQALITVDEIPRNSTGKIDKAMARAAYGPRLAAVYAGRRQLRP